MPKRTISCDHCGEEIKRWPSHINDQNFCSPECRKVGMDRPTGEDHHRYNRITVACDWCGDDVEEIPAHVEKFDRHFCDNDCKSAWQAENWSGDGHHQANRITVECAWCGDDLQRIAHRVERNSRHFCDQDCKGAWWSANVHGEEHPNWDGGREDSYGHTWQIQRRAARARDAYRCFLCGITERENEGLTGRELSVHHVIPKEEFDTRREANRIGNLLTVCDRCHAALHRL